jgi:ABC-2 type transport system permease protein
MEADMRQAAIIWHLWKATVIQAMEYRASFVFSIIANFFDFIFGLLQYLVFFTAAKSIAGWDADQMLVLYGVFMLVFALHFILLYPNLAAMGEMVNSGNLDLLLTKPVNAQLMVSFRRISLEELGSIGTAAILLGWLFYTGAIVASASNLFLFAVAMLSSLLLVYCVFLLLICMAVVMEKLDNSSQLLWSMFSLCRYPVDVYPSRVRYAFYSFFPVAFIATVPASALLGRADSKTIWLGLALSIAGVFICSWLWNRTIRSYTSAGG